MNSKILLLSIAVISVGLFAMPSTLSLFAGQHTFDKAGNTTICAKCHSDVLSEITNSQYHKSLIGSNSECKGCHTSDRINATLIPKGNQTSNWTVASYVGLDIANGKFIVANASTANGTTINVGSVHAAVTIECVWCHSAVNLTNDAHSVYASYANGNTSLKGSNAACIGCHTKTIVNMTWVRKTGYNTNYDFNTSALTFTVNSTANTTITTNQ